MDSVDSVDSVSRVLNEKGKDILYLIIFWYKLCFFFTISLRLFIKDIP
jgi:hypothetical protein